MPASTRPDRSTDLVIPRLRQQPQIHREPALHKLLLQDVDVAPRVARHVAGLLHVRQRNHLDPRVGLEDGLEGVQGGVNGAAQRRGGDQADLRVVGEPVAQLAALFAAEICEDGVWEDVVCG